MRIAEVVSSLLSREESPSNQNSEEEEKVQGGVTIASLRYPLKGSEEFKALQCHTLYAALLLPFEQFEYEVKKGKIDKVYNRILQDSLVKSKEVMKFVRVALSCVADGIENCFEYKTLKAGLFMRETGGLWRAI